MEQNVCNIVFSTSQSNVNDQPTIIHNCVLNSLNNNTSMYYGLCESVVN